MLRIKSLFTVKTTSDLLISEFNANNNDFSWNPKGEHLRDILHPDYKKEVCRMLTALGNGESISFDVIAGRVKGRYLFLLGRAIRKDGAFNIYFRKHGDLSSDCFSGNDTVIKEAADRLLGIFYRSDKFGNFIYFTENSIDLLGYTPEELVGGSLRSQFFLSEDKYDRLKNKVIEQGCLKGAEISLKHKNGQIIWLKVDNIAFYDENGVYAGTAGYVQDITQYRNTEEELRHTRHLLELKQKELDSVNISMKYRVQSQVKKGRKEEEAILYHSRLAEMGEMVSSIAHQWRQPLSALTFIIEDIRDAYHFGELDIKYLDDAIDESMSYVRFMSETMDDFRNFFRPEPDKEHFNMIEKLIDVVKMQYGRFEVAAVNVNIVCNMGEGEPENLLNIEYGRGISFFTNPVETATDIVVYGYPNLFKQVMINVLNNAIDAVTEAREKGLVGVLDPGLISIEVWTKATKAFVQINDNGVGLDSAVIDKIFEAEYTTKPKNKGTGIGLHMAKSIVEKSLGGRIRANKRDRGASFTIEVPVVSVSIGT